MNYYECKTSRALILYWDKILNANTVQPYTFVPLRNASLNTLHFNITLWVYFFLLILKHRNHIRVEKYAYNDCGFS